VVADRQLTTRLPQRIHRTDRVRTVIHAPTCMTWACYRHALCLPSCSMRTSLHTIAYNSRDTEY